MSRRRCARAGRRGTIRTGGPRGLSVPQSKIEPERVNQMTFQPLRNPGASTMMMSEAAAITMHNQAKVQISSSTLSLISNSLLDSDDTKVEGMTCTVTQVTVGANNLHFNVKSRLRLG